MDIGEHCNVCGQLDFLPFSCKKCGQTLCGSHRMHDCVNTESTNSPPGGTKTTPPKTTLSHSGPPKPPIAAAAPTRTTPPRTVPPRTAPKLNKAPSGTKPNTERAIAALERFKQLVGVKGKPPKTSPVSLEMKRTSLGDSSVKLADRAYFKVSRAPQVYRDKLTNKETLRPSKEVNMFFSKQITAGQLLDKAGQKLGLNGKELYLNGEVVDLAVRVGDLVQGTSLEVH